MLFYEKYAVSHINFSTGRILIEHSADESDPDVDRGFDGLIHGFSKLTGGRRESMGMQQYRVTKSPYDFIFQIDGRDGIVITVEDMRKIDEIVRYIKNAIADINANMLYENAETDAPVFFW